MIKQSSEYRVLHFWVERQLGKPRFCVECGTTTAKKYDWANISGEYRKDVSDWQRMCHSCHLRMDQRRDFCVNGHKLTDDNIYIRPTRPTRRQCKTCRLKQKSDYYYRNKVKISLKMKEKYARSLI